MRSTGRQLSHAAGGAEFVSALNGVSPSELGWRKEPRRFQVEHDLAVNIPANSDLADASMRLARHPTRLKRLLLDLPQESYLVILIDTGKGLDPLVINALAAADEVVLGQVCCPTGCWRVWHLHPSDAEMQPVVNSLTLRFGCSVDVGTPDSLKPRIRENVMEEAIRVT